MRSRTPNQNLLPWLQPYTAAKRLYNRAKVESEYSVCAQTIINLTYFLNTCFNQVPPMYYGRFILRVEKCYFYLDRKRFAYSFNKYVLRDLHG